MSNKEQNFISLPENVEYLFNNIIIDIISFMCVLSTSKKSIELEELLFYYSLSVSYVDVKIENNNLGFGIQNAKYEANSLYLYIKDHVQYIITYLSHNELINISVDKSEYPNKILLSINETGKESISKLQNNYFYELIERTKQLKKIVKYTKTNKNKVFRGEYYDVD